MFETDKTPMEVNKCQPSSDIHSSNQWWHQGGSCKWDPEDTQSTGKSREQGERNWGQARTVMLHLISGRKSKAKEGILSHSWQFKEGWGEVGGVWFWNWGRKLIHIVEKTGEKICGGSHSVPGSSLEVTLSPHRALSLLLHDRTLTLVDLTMFLAVGKMTEVRKMKSDFPGMQSLTQGSKSLVRKNGLLCNWRAIVCLRDRATCL